MPSCHKEPPPYQLASGSYSTPLVAPRHFNQSTNKRSKSLPQPLIPIQNKNLNIKSQKQMKSELNPPEIASNEIDESVLLILTDTTNLN